MSERDLERLIPGAYWVEPGRLLAGPYPAEYHPLDTHRNLHRLLEAGVRSFVSLMEAREETDEPDGPAPYVKHLEHAARRLGVSFAWERHAIHDMSVPELGRMDAILDGIEASLAAGRPVYAHCWRGRGRTGTVVGAYLIRRGLATPENFVRVIASLRPEGAGPSPETDEQIAFVRRHAEASARF